jgi:glycine hydroxymethyltransferase
MVLCTQQYAKDLDKAVFPGLQGGPLVHIIAAKAACFKEASEPAFAAYQRQIIANAARLAGALSSAGFRLVSGGTDNHLMLVDLRPKKLTGKAAEVALGRAEITCNKNGVPFDPEKPWVTSGIRLGAPAATSRGFGAAEFKKVGELIVETLDGVAKNGDAGNAAVEASVRGKVEELTKRFPIY